MGIQLQPDAELKIWPSRRPPIHLRKAIEAELQRLVERGVLEPVETARCAFPTVNVVKASGAVRICGDFKPLNRFLLVDQQPIPLATDLFRTLAGGKKFTRIDLSDAYHQLCLDKESQEILVINTHKGLYKYLRLPFGISSAPALFQRIMSNVLDGLPRVASFADDIALTGDNDQDHLQNLSAVLQRLKQHGLQANKSKCAFLQPSVKYLGHVIDSNGVRASDSKLKAVQAIPSPKNQTELRSFLGLVNYFRQFYRMMADATVPLNQLLQKDTPWIWSARAKSAFERLKKRLTSLPVVTNYDEKLPVGLSCDASSKGIGACLFHFDQDGAERVIAYASKCLTTAEMNYSQVEEEGLSIVFGVQKFRHFLLGRKFVLRTDHRPLLTIFNATKVTPPTRTSSRLTRWALQLSQYDYQIEYKNSRDHGNADALSRLPIGTDVKFDESNKEEEEAEKYVAELEKQFIKDGPIYYHQLQKYTSSDSILRQVIHYIHNGWPSRIQDSEIRSFVTCKHELSVVEGCILKHNEGVRMVIPKAIRPQLLQQLHRAHVGTDRMKQLACRYIWWPNINADIDRITKCCEACTLYRNKPPVVPLHPWEFPHHPWARVHIDYAGPFFGFMWLIIVDAYSKWPEVVKLHVGSTSAKQTVWALTKIFARFGVPWQVVTDNGLQFKTFCNQRGILHSRIPAYHPSSNGQAERFVQTFKRGIKKGMEEEGAQLEDVVDTFLAVYRNTSHHTTGECPVVSLMGRPLRCVLDLLQPYDGNHSDQQLQDKVRLSQEKQKNYDKKARHRKSLVLGDAVLVRQPDRQGKEIWRPATIVSVLETQYYEVLITDSGTRRKVHMNQLLHRSAGKLPVEDMARSKHTEVTSYENSDTDDDDVSGRQRYLDHEEPCAPNHEEPPQLRKSNRETKGRPPKRFGDWY